MKITFEFTQAEKESIKKLKEMPVMTADYDKSKRDEYYFDIESDKHSPLYELSVIRMDDCFGLTMWQIDGDPEAEGKLIELLEYEFIYSEEECFSIRESEYFDNLGKD